MAKLLIIGSTVLACSFISSAYAEETLAPSTTTPSPTNATTTTVKSISKDEWLKAVIPVLPEMICKGFENDPQLKKRFDDVKMTHEQCLKSVPESIDKCKQQLYSNFPEQITNEAAATWGKTFGECIGADFAVKYLIPKGK